MKSSWYMCNKDTVSLTGRKVFKGMIGQLVDLSAPYVSRSSDGKMMIHLRFPYISESEQVDLKWKPGMLLNPEDFTACYWGNDDGVARSAAKKNEAITKRHVSDPGWIIVCKNCGSNYFRTIGLADETTKHGFSRIHLPVPGDDGDVKWVDIGFVAEDHFCIWEGTPLRVPGSYNSAEIAQLNAEQIAQNVAVKYSVTQDDFDYLLKFTANQTVKASDVFKRKETETMPFTFKKFHVQTIISMPEPQKIFFRNPTTVVFWKDGTVTSVRCSKDDEFTEFGGYTAALAKKLYGNHSDITHAIEKARAKDTAPVAPPPSWVEKNKTQKGR